MSKDLEFHEAATIFPLLEGEELQSLAKDIKDNGLQRPVELLDGKIIDGRNRKIACSMVGVELRTIDVETSEPIAYVVSANLHRRQLTLAQRAMVAARARELYAKQAKDRQRLSEGRGVKKGPVNLPDLNQGDARDKAGKATGVSGRTVDYATRVLKKGTPELVKAVDDGRMAISTAAALAAEPPEVQRREADIPKRDRQHISSTNGVNREETSEPEPGKFLGVGVLRANEAINALKRIPKNDPLRKRGFQIVTDWIKANA